MTVDTVDTVTTATLKGTPACAGVVTGTPVFIPEKQDIPQDYILKLLGKHGDNILVMPMTTPAIVPILKHIKGIVTFTGGMLCHAAIIAREFSIPTVVACQALKEYLVFDEKELDFMQSYRSASFSFPLGMQLTIDGGTGEVTILQGKG